MKEPYTRTENTALVFAARYTHNRNTGGTLAIVRCLIINWHRIAPSTQDQILLEAYNEAQYNRDDWQKLFDHANYKPTEQ
jgi:hypothetical protein